eukprot:342215_1
MHFALFCNARINVYILGVIGLVDIAACIGFLIAFISPLRNISKQTDKGGDELLDVSTQAAILTSFAIISSFVLLLSLSIAPESGEFIFCIDCLANVISLMLMTKYYKDNKYFNYHSLCGG